MQRLSAKSALAEGRNPVDVALVGLGSAASLTLRALRQRTDVRVVAGVDPVRVGHPDLSPAAIVLERVSDLPSVDAVVIATPTPTHVDVCREVLLLAVPPRTLFCEKPISLDWRDVAILADEAAARGVVLRGLLHYGFAPEVLWLRNRIHMLPPVESADCRFEDPYGHELADREAVLCSSWADSGINALCVLQRLVGLRGVVSAASDGRRASRIVLKIESAGAVAEATITTCWGDQRTEKRTILRLRGGRVVELDHAAGICRVDGIVEFAESTVPAQARYDAMFRAHLDDPGLLHSADEVRSLHRLLTLGMATAYPEY